MASYSLSSPAVGMTGDIHDEARNPVGMSARDTEGRRWVYLKGVANTVEGSVVTFDEAGVTTLLAANAKGPVAVAGAAIVASKYGWYCREAEVGVGVRVVTATADNTLGGRETTDGEIGDGRAAGDEIYNLFIRGANSSGSTALTTCQLFNPFVDDANGA